MIPLQQVIFVNRYFWPDESATSQMLTDIAKRLAAQQIQVRVICSRQLYDHPDALLPAQENIDGVSIYRVWTSRFGRGQLAGRAVDYASFYLSAASRLLALTRKHDIVVAKTDPPMLSIMAAVVSRLRGAALINWLQDIFPEVATELNANPLPRWVSSLLSRLRDRSLRTAKCNVVLGNRMRDHLLSCAIDHTSIRVIENWADGVQITPQARNDNRLRREYGLAEKFVVAYSGNLGRAHEFQTIVGAADLLRAQKDIAFLMIGGGVKMQQLQAEVARLNLHNFLFLPHQPRESLADSLSAADVHLACLLPLMEGLIVPSKIYGILAAGRPVIFIGDSEGEIAQVIRRASCGVSINTGDGLELARAIRSLQENPTLASQQSACARQAFDAHYTLDAATAKWLRVLNDSGLQL